MNELESKGQKWFYLVSALGVGPYVWNLIRYIYSLISSSPSGLSVDFHIALLEKLIPLVLVGGVFFLMYRGNSWSKWLYVSIALLFFLGSVGYYLMILLGTDVIGPLQKKHLFVQIIINFCFLLIPALLLAFSASLNAFLTYRYRLAHGDEIDIEKKLDQIGNDK